MNRFSSTIEGPNQHSRPSTIFTLSERMGKAKQFTIGQLHFDNTQGLALCTVKVFSSSVEVSRLSPTQERLLQRREPRPSNLSPQQHMVNPQNHPYQIPGHSSPDAHILVPVQRFHHLSSPSKTLSLLSSLSSRAESYLNKSVSGSFMFSSPSGTSNQGFSTLGAHTSTELPIATINFHSISSKIDVSLHPAQRTFTIAKLDSFSSSYCFDMPLPLPPQGPSQSYSQRQLAPVKWKEEENMPSGNVSGVRLETIDTRQTIARYHKKFKLKDGNRSAIEIFLPHEQLDGLEVLHTVIVTAVAMAKYRADADKAEKEVAKEVMSALVGG